MLDWEAIGNNDPDPKSPTETGDNENFPTLKIRVVSPMPELEAHLDFSLSTADETGVLWTLRSTMNPNVRLFAVPPIAFFNGYSPITPSSTWLRIGLVEGASPFILMIAHSATGSYPHTTNLLVPPIINPDTMSTLQVMPKDQDRPL